MSGIVSVDRYTFKMTISEQDILRTLMKSRDRIAVAAWVVVRDAHAAEDIFQNVALKALTKEVCFDTEGALLSWTFITTRREGIDWLRRHRKESTGLDSEILELLEQEWLCEPVHRGELRMEALRTCLKKLPEKSNCLLRLRYFEGNSCRDIAEQLGAELNAVYKRLSRLHKGLKECVEFRLEKSEVTET
jgi:RNA polymerase sigma-70 factor (ECF subfamily)